MENVGVGDYHFHLAHILRDVIPQRGGSISSEEINFDLFDCIRSGLVNGLAYDATSDRVYLTSHSRSPQPRVVPLGHNIHPATRVTGWQGLTASPLQQPHFRRAGVDLGSRNYADQHDYSPSAVYGTNAVASPAHPTLAASVNTPEWKLKPAAELQVRVDRGAGYVERENAQGANAQENVGKIRVRAERSCPEHYAGQPEKSAVEPVGIPKGPPLSLPVQVPQPQEVSPAPTPQGPQQTANAASSQSTSEKIPPTKAAGSITGAHESAGKPWSSGQDNPLESVCHQYKIERKLKGKAQTGRPCKDGNGTSGDNCDAAGPGKSGTDTAMHRSAGSDSGTDEGRDDGGDSPTSLNANAPEFVSRHVDGKSRSESVAKDRVPTGTNVAGPECQQASPGAINFSGIPQAGLPTDPVITPGGSKGSPSDSGGGRGSECLFIHDGPSMKDAAAVLNASAGEQGDAGQLIKAFVGAGPVAVRLNGKNLGAKDAVVSTVQIAGTFSAALVFDVQSLLQAPGGLVILVTELRSLLVDSRICKVKRLKNMMPPALHRYKRLPQGVMHDVHDQAVAFARLFRVPRSRFESVVDMQIVQEALTGNPLKSFTDCLRYFNLYDGPSRKFSMDEGDSVRRPLSTSILQNAVDGVVLLRKAFLLAEETLKVKVETQMARVIRASQMKVDFATDKRRNGWRRMVAINESDGNVGNVRKTLASYEFHMEPKLFVRFHRGYQREGPMPISTASLLASKKPKASKKLLHPINQPWTDGAGAAPICGNALDATPKGAITFGDMCDVDGGEGFEVGDKEQAADVANVGGESGSGAGQKACGNRTRPSCNGHPRGNSKGRVEDDVLEMLRYFPKVFMEGILSGRDPNVRCGLEEIVLDQGRRPRAVVRGKGIVYICEDESVLVTRYHINCIVGRLEREGMFEADDRTGFDGLLHRIAVIRDKNGTIYGVTIQVGRYVKGCVEMVSDIIYGIDLGNRRHCAPSILVLGGHGSGKTTLVRDMCRKLSATESVVIVDTTNEIGGEGLVPHREAIGMSRRLMIPHDTMQHRVMRQAIRNHRPQTLAVDNISSQEDVEACKDIKARGVRVIAGAVGDLPSVLDCQYIGGALGGLMPVDSSASDGDDASHSAITAKKERRVDKPVFDVVIELEGREEPMLSVVTNVATVVDELLDKGCVRKSEIRAPFPSAEVVDKNSSSGGECNIFLLKVAQDSSDKWLW